MGNYNLPLELRDSMGFTTSGGALIVASAQYLDAVMAEGALRGYEAVRFMALSPDTPVSAEALNGPAVVVIEVDPTSDASLQRLATMRVERPDLSIIVALKDASVALVRTLIRQGVTDVAQLPFQPDNLATQILDALSAQTERFQPGIMGPMVAIAGASGGSGATTLLTHLASAMAAANQGGRGVCLIDLDLQGGDVASYVGASPKVTVDELIAAGSRLDAELFRSAITDTSYGFKVIAAPDGIQPIDKIDTDHLLAMLRLARSMFDYVLVDLPPVWNNWSLSVITASERVVLITDTAINSVRQAKRRLRLFDEIDLPAAKIDLVVNRVERKLFRSVNESDIGGVLGCSVVATLPAENAAINNAQDEGRLVTDGGGKSRYADQVAHLADTLADRMRGD